MSRMTHEMVAKAGDSIPTLASLLTRLNFPGAILRVRRERAE
jgi:hypothetical protein